MPKFTQPTPSSPIVAASYERVSTRNQGQFGFSLGGQHKTLEESAADQAWPLPDHLRFVDGKTANASGADWDLPGLTRMLHAAKQGEFSKLLVYDLDRFARSMAKGLALEEQLKKYGVDVVYTRVPFDDTAEGRMMKRSLFNYAEYEREKIGIRSMMGRTEKATLGMVVGGGPPPYGYRFTYVALENGKRRPTNLEEDPITGPIARRILRELPTRSPAEIAADAHGRRRPAAARRRALAPVDDPPHGRRSGLLRRLGLRQARSSHPSRRRDRHPDRCAGADHPPAMGRDSASAPPRGSRCDAVGRRASTTPFSCAAA